MQTKSDLIRKISPLVKLLILIILIICLLVANSIYLILLLTTFTTILIIISSEKVNVYVKFIKMNIFLLLILLIIYIIIYRECSYFDIIDFIYKEILISTMIKLFSIYTNFDELHEALYGLIRPLKVIDTKRASFNIALSIYLIKFFLESSYKIKKIQTISCNQRNNLYKEFLSRIIYSTQKLDEFELRLKLNFYTLKYKKVDLKSKIILLTFVLFLIVCLFKEVYI